MRNWLINLAKSNSLARQIRDAERHIILRQRRIDIRTDRLVRIIHVQMTTPATLLLVTGAGFIVGELTKRQPSKVDGSSNKREAIGLSPLKLAINLITSIQTLYTALPIAWMMTTFFQSGSSGRPSKQNFHRTTSVSEKTETTKTKGNP